MGGASLAALVSSITVTDAPDTLVQRVTDALVEFALYNYPKGAGEYLRYALEHTVFPLEASTARRALEQNRRYYDRLAGLSELTELRTPASRRYLLHLERVKMHQRIRETAREESDFMSLVHTITLKHGRASFDTRNGVPSAPQPLHSFSYEMELPRGESIDPIGQRLRRLEARMARVTKPANSKERSAERSSV